MDEAIEKVKKSFSVTAEHEKSAIDEIWKILGIKQ
jgi:hypothetical protein